MIRRILGLFDRYAQAHSDISGRVPGGVLRDGAGRIAARIDRVVLDDQRLRVAGQSDADRIMLTFAGRETTVARPDGQDGAVAFELTLPRPRDDDAVSATLRADDGPEAPLRFPHPTVTRAGQAIAFTWAGLRVIPYVIGWARTGDPRHRGAVKRGLGLQGGTRFGPLDPQLLGPGTPPPPPGPFTVILPVHGGHDLLIECLDRLERHTAGDWRLILIEDASPDDRIRPLLRARANTLRAAGRQVDLIEPDANLGFVGAVNAALDLRAERGGDDPVILLNSDALVPPDWAPRLLAPLDDAQVASVTPLSNDAEITTVPVICSPTSLPPGMAEDIDTALAQLNPKTAQADMPTGVGFCMALSPHFLDRVPRLDTIFGRGYGEEVDWCQKTRALGGRHVGAARLFVEHRGGSSFGAEAKRAGIARAQAVIEDRYPTYAGDVQRFIATDPLRGPRLVGALTWASAMADAAGQAVPIYLAHSLGGGADIWLDGRMAADMERGLPSVVLRVGGTDRSQLEVHAPGGVTGGFTDDAEQIAELLAGLPRRDWVYSCGVGDPDPVALPDLILSMRAPGDGLAVLLHDWLPLSPSYTLLGVDGTYRGVPLDDDTDPAHRARRPDGTNVPLSQWRAAWGRLLTAADRVTVFAESGRAILSAAYPDLAPDRVEVVPHARPDPTLFHVADPPAAGRPVVGIMGHVNAHKGAQILADLARADGAPPIVILGQVDPALTLPRAIRVHGGYSPPDIPDLVRRHRITHWLMPAIWPETFSFATHEALATGLPVLAFDIGAQGAAVAAAPNGTALPLGADPTAAILTSLASHARDPA